MTGGLPGAVGTPAGTFPHPAGRSGGTLFAPRPWLAAFRGARHPLPIAAVAARGCGRWLVGEAAGLGGADIVEGGVEPVLGRFTRGAGGRRAAAAGAADPSTPTPAIAAVLLGLIVRFGAAGRGAGSVILVGGPILAARLAVRGATAIGSSRRRLVVGALTLGDRRGLRLLVGEFPVDRRVLADRVQVDAAGGRGDADVIGRDRGGDVAQGQRGISERVVDLGDQGGVGAVPGLGVSRGASSNRPSWNSAAAES